MVEPPRRIVVDTHIFLTALVGIPSEERDAYVKLIEVCHRLVVNARILEEYRLISNRHGLSASVIDSEIIRLRSIGKIERAGNPRGRSIEVGPAQDRPFLECALASGASLIITNDPGLTHANGRLKRSRRNYRTEALSAQQALVRLMEEY